MENVVIQNPGDLNKKKEAMKREGIEKLHVLADFDRTLTRAFVREEYVPAIIWVLYNGEYLSPNYAKKAQVLHEKYHNLELDPGLSKEEKIESMREWWTKHFKLLIDEGLSKEVIRQVVNSGKIQLREGAEEFLKILKEKKIPLVIMSSSGLGGEAISIFLKDRLYSNIHIISNSFVWDEEGKAISVKKPIIHGMNKYETVVRDYPVFEKIKDRKNIILLGDSLDDVGMVEGFDVDNVIKVGFLNKDLEKNLEYYKERYDVIILGDSSMDFVVDLLREVGA